MKREQIIELCKKVEDYIINDDSYDNAIVSGHTANRFDKIASELLALQGEEKSIYLNPDKVRNALNKYCSSFGRGVYAVSRADFEKVISESCRHNEDNQEQPKLTDEMIEEEANLRYGEITGGQYLRSRPHDIAVFKSGAKWARDFYKNNKEE